MKFEGADNPVTVAVSGIVLIGGIVLLLWWGYHYAYL
jgi:hypothetical protein